MSYRILNRADLKDPGHMQPAIALKSRIDDLADRLNTVPLSAPGENDSAKVVLVQIDGVQIALIAYENDPGFVHLYIHDHELKSFGFDRIEQLLGSLPFNNIEGGWWDRPYHPAWPSSRSFVIHGKGTPVY